MKHLLKLFILLLFPLMNYGQSSSIYEIGLPLVRNYTTSEYKAFSQNWGFVQDDRGVLYFANGEGVLEFDGIHWKTIKIVNDYVVFGIAIDKDNKVFVGSSSEVGYLASTKNGDLTYHSLLNYFPPNERKFNHVKNLLAIKSGVFFIAGGRLYKWNDKTLRSWSLANPGSCFKLHDNILVWQSNIGLNIFLGDTILKLQGGDFFADKAIQNILPFKNNKMLVVCKDSGIYVMSDPFKLKRNAYPEIYRFYNQADYFISNNQLLNGTALSNGDYAFATLRGGTAIIDNNGTLVQILNKKAGIQNESHNNLGQDSQNALWISLNNGISRVDISSPLSTWNDDMGLKGAVLSSVRFKNKMFVATWEGVFYLDLSSEKYTVSEDEYNIDISRFKPIEGIKSHAWDLLVVKNFKNPSKDKLLVACTDGIYEVDLFCSKLLFKASASKLYKSNRDQSLIYAGTDEGVYCLSIDYSGDELTFRNMGKLKGLNEKVSGIGEDKSGKLWVSTEYASVYLFEFEKLLNKRNTLPIMGNQCYTVSKYSATDGLPSNDITIYNFRDKLLFVSEDGIFFPVVKYKGNKVTGVKFIKDRTISLGFLEKTFYVTMMTEDKMGNVWLQITNKFTKQKIMVEAVRNKNNLYSIKTIPFKPMPQTEVYSIYPEESNVTWFGGDDGLIRYDGNRKYGYNMDFHALIRRVVLERDSVLFGGTYYTDVNDSGEYIGHSLEQPEELKSQISYAFNSITFEYAAPSYYDEKSKYYKVYLEGFDKKWSGWANETKKEYTNLPPGKYKFHVIAKNIFDKESSEALYEFRILAPWYRTWFAYFIYLIAFAFVIYSAIKFSNNRLREAKLRLEDVVKERTTDLNKQKKELEKEKEKADKLLLNILPFKIAEELKANGNAKTKTFEQVTVLFSDFKDFTVIAQQMEPQELISDLNRCFIFFDDVCVRHNIEKIKTVGDSYMCAGGVPMKNKTNPVDMILAAFEMRDFISRLKKEQSSKGHTLWKIRIGINTGPIISGVVGKKKFAYDIWGDTVNTASRLEQASQPNKINISEDTYELVKNFFDCTPRGKIPVKHKGDIDMYFVEKIKNELSVDEEGRIPNQNFWELYETLNT